MPTSGTINSTLNARQVIDTAAEMIGVKSLGDDLSDDEADLGLKHLNWMLKSWQADGLTNGWRVEEVTLTWPADTATVTLDTNYLALDDVRRQASAVDTPLTAYTLAEYAEIPNKTSGGAPLIYSVRKTISTLAVSLWPVPTADTTIIANASRVIEDVTALTQNIDVPQEWLETVFTCLAARLVRPFRVHLSDPAGAQIITQAAETMYARLKDFDQEGGSVFLQPY